ncbi:SDR family NAD(P)-dependent oxidoreductase [Microbacterium paludicola]|uniref:SDR family NAD(P)-dependent oxidoreductase n=1 Tax=Microbacterium paludicola TaxID=300019 RepID=UPI00142F68F6|nr:SDR family oxidoreductase [Microbacterium paludicola]MBF0816243.1 SDR family oxidoreductase [Microbacterium paludicola]
MTTPTGRDHGVQDLVVITGASGGIGRAIVRGLVASGHAVVLHYHRNESAARTLAEEIGAGGARAFIAQADLTEPSGVGDLVAHVDQILEATPGLSLHGLVNNAARLLGPSFDDASPEQFDLYFALNTRAPLFLTQQLSARMSSGGSIVNVSSAGAHFSSAGDIVYAMSKAALESLTRNAAEALAPRGIRINTVIPGFTDNGHPALAVPGVREYVSTYALLGGIASPAPVADAVAFLLSPHAGRTTGTALDVTGGSTLGARPRSSKISLRDIIAQPGIAPR